MSGPALPGPRGAARGARALVIGWDGATWDLAARFAAEGELPVLSDLVARGMRGPLASTVPPMTLPAWSSLLTGCNPGKHGIFDFMHREPGSWRLVPANATQRRVPTIHRLLSDRGARVASLAVPTTWPPEPLDGVVVSGFDSPVSTGIDGSFCHPPALWGELERRFGGLRFADFQESVIGPGWHEQALASLLREVERKAEVGRWLLGGERWDLFMLLFGESDTASHHLWMFHDADSPRHPHRAPPALRDGIRSVYRALDRALGRLLEVAQPDVLCICSDHGFGGAGVHALYLNRLLEQSGWLRFRRRARVEGLRGGGGLLDAARDVAVRRLPAGLQGRLYRAVPDRLLGRIEADSRYGALDRRRTRALSDELNYAATLRLEVPPGEREAATAELAELLLSWRVDGHAPVAAVHRREDLYSGPCVERSPDLVIELALRDGYSYTLLPSARVAPGTTWRVLAPAEHVGGKGLGMNGSHRPDGLLLLQGRGVREGGGLRARLEDVAPTLLHLLGEAVPDHVDGRILTEALLRAGPDQRAPWQGEVAAEQPASPSEAAAIRQRLERLGYL